MRIADMGARCQGECEEYISVIFGHEPTSVAMKAYIQAHQKHFIGTIGTAGVSLLYYSLAILYIHIY